MLRIPVRTLLTGIYHFLIAITISEWKSISGAISDFWNFEILRPFSKPLQHSNTWRLSEACRSNVLLATQRKMETQFCLADFFQNYKAISFYWLICQTKVARFLEVSCIILHFSWRKLQESCKNGKKMRCLGGFWQETSDLSTFPAKKRLLSRSIFPWKIFSENF